MTTLQHAPLDVALTTTRPVLPSSDELSGRLAEHLVAGALVRKSVNDPVPFAVWWRVSDALRSSVRTAPADAVAEVDDAIAALVAQVRGLATGPAVSHPLPEADADRALRLAQVLLARLIFATVATSPTLLHVRLARLRRALVDAAAA